MPPSTQEISDESKNQQTNSAEKNKTAKRNCGQCGIADKTRLKIPTHNTITFRGKLAFLDLLYRSVNMKEISILLTDEGPKVKCILDFWQATISPPWKTNKNAVREDY